MIYNNILKAHPNESASRLMENTGEFRGFNRCKQTDILDKFS